MTLVLKEKCMSLVKEEEANVLGSRHSKVVKRL